jgi:hypothetical protein
MPPTGKSSSTLPEGFTLVNDPVMKSIELKGKPDMVGTWKFALKANSPSNNNAYSAIAVITVNDATGIKDMELKEATDTDLENSECYDLQGRRPTGELLPGIYIINGKKYVIK